MVWLQSRGSLYIASDCESDLIERRFHFQVSKTKTLQPSRQSFS